MSKSLAQRVVFRTMLGNVFLVILKLSAGLAAASAALVAEAVHSAGEILASLWIYISFRLSGKPADDRHHFGYGKIESVATCLAGLLLIYLGFILTTGVLANLSANEPEIPGALALYVSLICLILKEGMYRYTIKAACKTGSRLLFADAWHHRTDMMILAGVSFGIAGARMGYPLLDGFVALIISVLIIRLGVGICRQGFGEKW